MKLFSINRISIAGLFILFSALLFSCQKDLSSASSNAVSETDATTYAEESTTAEASFDDVDDVAQTAADEENNASEFGINGRVYFPAFTELRGAIGDCATITVTPNDSTYPKKITIDFGDSCVGRDGKLRSGAILIYLTAPLRRPGSVLTVMFRDFYLNHVKLEGTKTISNLSNPPVHTWKVTVENGKVTFPSGRGYSFESVKYKTQIEGADTRTIRDDVYKIEGRSVTIFNNGVSINFNTETPLIKKATCRWISDGVLKIKINSRELFLDYGAPNNGDCDNKALLTWDNGIKHRLITL